MLKICEKSRIKNLFSINSTFLH